MTTDFCALCAELVRAWDVTSDFDYNDFGNSVKSIVNRARAALADGPAVPESREPASVVQEPSDAELALIYHDCCRGCEFMDQGGFENAARAVLARWGNLKARVTSSIPADGEVAELVAKLRRLAPQNPLGTADPTITRAAELLQRQAQQTLPQGLIPMEYVDADSSARIVSEPSEDGPGGCWVVRNSRHVNPCTEFPTAEAAWDALQRAQSLPSTVGPFDRIKFTCHLVPREQADG